MAILSWTIHVVFKRHGWRLTPILLLLFFLNAGLNPTVQASSSREYAIKAAFLYNFAKFVEWPLQSFEDSTTPIILCILGKDPFGVFLKPIKDKTVKGKKIIIKYSPKIDDMEKCHVLFVGKSEDKQLVRILARIRDWNVLTVSDIGDFAQRGGIIGLTKEEDEIHFEINLEASKMADLKISSRLLKIARIINMKSEGRKK